MTSPRRFAVLLDTHTWIWRTSEPNKLSAAAKQAIADAAVVGVSAVSPWELALKQATGKLTLHVDIRTWVWEALGAPKTRLEPLEPAIAIAPSNCAVT